MGLGKPLLERELSGGYSSSGAIEVGGYRSRGLEKSVLESAAGEGEVRRHGSDWASQKSNSVGLTRSEHW